MLTAAQCETVAYTTPWGEFFCAACTVDRLETDGGGGVEGFEPVIAYSLDEYQQEASYNDRQEDDFAERYPGCTDDCVPRSIECDACGRELVEPYHYGHETEDEDA